MSGCNKTGVDGFFAGLRRCGCDPKVRNGVAVFTVIPVGGSYAGHSVESGVGADELQAFPSAPPHWVHLPNSVSFGRTNSRPSSIPGWLMHSRNVKDWGNAEEPAQAWLAHVRAVLAESS